jgi:ELAV like protein 2/3/4
MTSETLDNRTNLMVNYLPPTMNEEELKSMFSTVGEIDSFKLVKGKNYGFLQYKNHETAKEAITKYNGMQLLGKTLKVDFARASESKDENSTNLYVAGLPRNLQHDDLIKLFEAFGDISLSKVFTQTADGTEREKPIAFVQFSKHDDAKRALDTLNGTVPGGFDEPITIKFSNSPGQSQNKLPQTSPMSLIKTNHNMFGNLQVNGETGSGLVLFVYNLAPEIQELDLWRLFGPFGAILNIKIVTDSATNQSKGYAFVTMVKYEESVLVIRALNGYKLADRVLQVNFKTNKGRINSSANNFF